VLHFSLDSINELFARFVEWEYATAMLGILLGVNPFDQPDVEDTKKRVRQILNSNLETVSNYRQIDCAPTDYVRLLRISDALWACRGIAADIDLSIDEALRALLASLQPNDYFSINAFLPFRGYGRREAMERMRNRVASRLGNVACLEIGPRYLHSTGQLHKGGPNNGVYLYLSADEPDDIGIPGENFTLGILAATQARGDFEALAFRGRRALQVHLAGNDSETLARFADRLCLAVSAIM
jgi:glucose-6-phosphate isomerase